MPSPGHDVLKKAAILYMLFPSAGNLHTHVDIMCLLGVLREQAEMEMTINEVKRIIQTITQGARIPFDNLQEAKEE